MIKRYVAAAAVAAIGFWLPLQARAVECVAGAYRAGCIGPNGAVVVKKPPPPIYRPPPKVTCVNGVYRAGCVGPNGAAVIRK